MTDNQKEIRRLTILLNDMTEYLYDHPDATTVSDEIQEIEATINDLRNGDCQ